MTWFEPRTPLALLNLIHQPTRTAVSVAGVAFAMLLIFMQLGFLGSVGNTATIIYERLPFDLLIRSPEYLHLYEARTVDRAWLRWVESQTDIEQVRPFWVMLQRWQTPSDGRFRAIAVLAQRLDQPVLQVPEIDQQLPLLTQPANLLIDRATRADFGPQNGRRFGELDINAETELGGQRIRIVGVFPLGTGLAANGQVILSDQGFARVAPWDAEKNCSLGLVKLRESARPEVVAQRLKNYLQTLGDRGESVEILTRAEVIQWERNRWIWGTPIGVIFQMGVLLAMLVGSAVVYQVLATDIANRLPEYATLKAMGYSQRFLAGLVLRQAWTLSLLSFIPAWLLAELLYRITSWAAGITIEMTLMRIVGVAALGLAMCTISGLLAVRKLNRAEPASLF